MSWARRGVALALFAAVCVPAAAQDQAPRKRIEIPRVESAPKLDLEVGGRKLEAGSWKLKAGS